ncbi:MAG: MFS transporter [Acidobacteria bacterium]|nr:MFS transporter [Acidobacteriota bacterium]MCB9399488.1 MFS transporter [Acidobacteriota bacterium]
MNANISTHPPIPGRWWILLFTSLVLFGNYYVYDSIGPVADLLESQLGFSDSQIGSLNGIYSLPNIIMVLIGGLLVDKFGPARVTLYTSFLCLIGAALTAIQPYWVMAAGRLIFGLGAETMIVAVTASLGQWFKGSNIALAMGLNLSMARLGSWAADVSPTFARSLYDQGWQAPLILAAIFASTMVVFAWAYLICDRKKPAEMAAVESEKMNWSDVLSFDRSYWYLLVLCVLFYSAILPFRSTFAIKYFQHAHDLSREAAGQMNSWVFFAAIFASPLFGLIADKLGYRTVLLSLGAFFLPLSFLILGTTDWHLGWTTVLIGISYSLVPAVLWPGVCYLVEEKRLGTAYGLMTMLQNVGLTIANFAAGGLNDWGKASADNPAGYIPMLWFFGLLSSCAFIFVVLLHMREKGPNGHGLA